MYSMKAWKAVFLSLMIVFSTITYPVLVGAADGDLIDLAISADTMIDNTIYLGQDGSILLHVNGTEEPSVETFPVDVVLVIDVSGSMALDLTNPGESGKPLNQQRLHFAKDAAKEFVDKMAENSNNHLSIVTLAHESQVALGLTKMDGDGVTAAKQAIDNLIACGGTNYYLALMQAKDVLSSSNSLSEDFVVFMSDGKPTTSNMQVPTGSPCPINYKVNGIDCRGTYDKSLVDYLDPSKGKESTCSGSTYNDDTQNDKDWDKVISLHAASEVINAGIDLYTIGFGPGAHQGILKNMVDNVAGKSFNAQDSEALSSAYTEISSTVTNFIASDVSVILKSLQMLII
jgi:hypothetical protein